MSVCAPQATQNGRAGSDGYWLRMSYGQVSASSALVFPQIPGTYKVFRCCAGCCEGCAMAKSAKGAVQAAVAAVRLLLTVRWRSPAGCCSSCCHSSLRSTVHSTLHSTFDILRHCTVNSNLTAPAQHLC